MVDKKKNEATPVASPRASSRPDKIKSGTDAQQEFVRQLRELFGGLGNLEVEPKIIIPTDQKPDKKKLN